MNRNIAERIIVEAHSSSKLVGVSSCSGQIIPVSFGDFTWCDSSDYQGDEGENAPVFISWQSVEEFARNIVLAGDQGAWVMADTQAKLSDIASLGSDFALICADSLDKVPFFLIVQNSDFVIELPNSIVLEVAVASAVLEAERNEQNLAVHKQSTHATSAAAKPKAAASAAPESELRRRIKFLVGGRQKQIAARLPRPVFRLALRIWKAL